MAKRGYKLQEFVAHSATVNCISIGKKTCRHFITGGDDNLVNLWAIGNPASLMSLYGHTSPVESVAFDSAEVLVAAGSSTGVIKLWDLEEVKMVRTLTGHKSYCTAVEFHPFGEFFASGSMDSNLKVWDIRKKGCIHTYKGHTRGISTIKFTPDGRWMVTGGLDNVVKVWDLTGGKLLHDFKFHEGHIRSIDFHPLEFLLATGSADKTVKFWDLETFELIGSTRREGTGVRAITFHPDGRALFCGLDDSLKVFSWEPVICHDGVDMGWSTLSDICIHEGNILGCSHFQNSVGVWVADISLIEPYGAGSELKNGFLEQKSDDNGSHLPEKVGNGLKSSLDRRSASSDYESNDIKTIYVDSTGGNNVPSCPDDVHPVDSKESTNVSMLRQCLQAGTLETNDGKTANRSIVVPAVLHRDSPDEKDFSNSQGENTNSRMVKSDRLLKPADNSEKLSVSAESKTMKKVAVSIDGLVVSNARLEAIKTTGSCEEKKSSLKFVAEKFEKILSPQTVRDHEKCSESQNSSKEISSVKFVNGVAVVRGRTRSLVERFEKREVNSNEDQTTTTCFSEIDVPEKVSTMIPETDKAVTVTHELGQATNVVPGADKAAMGCETDEALNIVPVTDKATQLIPETDTEPAVVPETVKASTLLLEVNKAPDIIPETFKKSTKVTGTMKSPSRLHAPNKRSPMITATGKRSPMVPVRQRRTPVDPVTDKTISIVPATARISPIIHETDKTSTLQSGLLQISGGESTSGNDAKVIEDLLQTHDVILSTFRSRLTKLQVIRHFWERNDIKGAISAMRKLPDHSVQADVLSIVLEKMEILTLDLFSCLLPVLVGLLDSNTERHIMISLEMLLKLVAVFGSVIRSSVSARPPVGVDLHAEERLECCNQCFVQLQKIQSMLPALSRRGGLVAKSALELNLVLQRS